MNSEQNTPQPDPNAETQRFDTTPVPSEASAGGPSDGVPAGAASGGAAPEAGAAAAGTAATGPAAGPAEEGGAKRRRRRNMLIGAAAAVAVLAVGGGAYAVGANVGDDDDDDRPGISDGGAPGQHDGDRDDRDGDDRRDGDRRDDDRDDTAGGQAAGPAPAADAASLRDAAEAAIAAADGAGATSIDLEDAGYEVEVLLADGQEVDVFVTADGTATPEPGQDDPRSDPALDLAQLDTIIEAAFAAAEAEGVTGGAIDSVSSSSDQGVAFEVSIRFDRGGDADIDLASDLSLVTADIDD